MTWAKMCERPCPIGETVGRLVEFASPRHRPSPLTTGAAPLNQPIAPSRSVEVPDGHVGESYFHVGEKPGFVGRLRADNCATHVVLRITTYTRTYGACAK